MSRTERTERILGREAIETLRRAHVTVAGLGGVGGHATEALVRAGIGHLHLIDADTVAESNLNRQLFAVKSTVGMLKTEAALKRLSDAGDAELTAVAERITPENAAALVPEETDLILDAIDDIPAKVALIKLAGARQIPIISCLGAGNRLDPTAFVVTDLFKTEGDPLARRLRQLLRKEGIDSLTVVFSRETPVKPAGEGPIGSFAPVTGAAGLTAAGAAIGILLKTHGSDPKNR